MHYDLTRLSIVQFGSLVRDILVNTIDLSVKPRADSSVVIDQAVKRRITWPAGMADQVWNGDVAIKAFYANPEVDPASYKSLITSELEKRLNAWRKTYEKSDDKEKTPKYILVIFGGSYDSLADDVDKITRKYRDIGIRSTVVWDYSNLCEIINQQPSIRSSYSALIAPEDVIAHLNEYLPVLDEGFCRQIESHLAMDLIADQWVRLNQASLANHQKLALSSVAVDLPLADDRMAAEYVLETGDRILKRSELPGKSRPHLVLVGGPGQGKTTIGQLVCQVYRTALLDGGFALPREASGLIDSVREAHARMGLREPNYRRWPIRVTLTSFADELISSRSSSLLRYIAQQISARVSENIAPGQLKEWMKAWPWFVVLDGLDEVSSQAAREILMIAISDFLVEAAQVDCDLLVLATTRPQGYDFEFPTERYTHIDLSPLNSLKAARYAKRLAEVQHNSDPDLMHKVIQRLEIAVNEPSTARLMRSPLQVTIMSLLLETRERAPQARYALFDAYYDVIYAREAAKPGAIGNLLEEFSNHINALHDRVGLLLQVQGENEGEADAAIPRSELYDLAVLRMKSEGFSEKDAQRRADLVIKAVTQRLVLIVPRALDEVGFEVRSIQEFMAARALVSGRDEDVILRLSLLVPSSHWRNTWLFAAGRIFSEREHLRRNVISLLEDYDNENLFNTLVAPGADLALDLLEDDVATSTPLNQRLLARHSLTLLQCPPDDGLQRRASILDRYANADNVIRAAVLQAINRGLEGPYAQRSTVDGFLEQWYDKTGGLGLRARQIRDTRSSALTRTNTEVQPHMTSDRLHEIIEFTLSDLRLKRQAKNSVDVMMREVEKETLRAGSLEVSSNGLLGSERREAWRIVDKCLSHSESSATIAKIALELSSENTNLSSELRKLMRIWLQRRPAGAELLQRTKFSKDADYSE